MPAPMDSIRVTVAGADPAGSSERTVDTGTKAWELFADAADQDQVIAARIDGELRDLAHVLVDGEQVEAVRDRLGGRPRHPPALRPRT